MGQHDRHQGSVVTSVVDLTSCRNRRSPAWLTMDDLHEPLNTQSTNSESTTFSSPSNSPSRPTPSPPLDYNDPRHYTTLHWPCTRLPRHLPYPLLLTYFFLAVAQSLPTTAINFLLIYDINLTPAAINFTYTLWFQLGVTRPLFTLLSDHVPLFGRRRKPYLIGATVLAMAGNWLMGWQVTGAGNGVIGWGVCVYLFWAVAEAMTDTVVVELGNQQLRQAIHRLGLEEQSVAEQRERRREYGLDSAANGAQQAASAPSAPMSAFARYTSPVDLITQRVKARLQAECMSVRTVGTITAYAFSIVMLRLAGRDYREVILLNTIVFVPAMVAACFIDDKRVKTAFYHMAAVHTDGTAAIADTDSDEETDSPTVHRRLSHPPRPHDDELPNTGPVFLRAKLSQLSISLRLAFLPIVFIFLYYAVPTSADTYYYFLYGGQFSFEAWQADFFSFLALLASLAGTLTYRRFLASTPIPRLFLLTFIAGLLAQTLRLLLVFGKSNWLFGMPPSVFIPVSGAVSSFVGGISNMLPIVLAHQYAPSLYGMEGTVFSLFQVADRLGVVLSGSLAGVLTDWLGIVRGNYERLWVLMVVCMALELPPVCCLPWLLRKKPPPDVEVALTDMKRRNQPPDDSVKVKPHETARIGVA